MPILYTCMLNAKEQVVFEGYYTDQRVSYKNEVLKRKLDFEYMMIKEIHLNEEDNLSMIYQHKGSLVLISVY